MNQFSKLSHISWSFVLLMTLLASAGFLALYSAAGGSFSPWALTQMVRYGIALIFFFLIALTPLKVWKAWTYPLYGITLVLLIVVLIMGFVGKGAQRWIGIGAFGFQPSELARIATIMALAYYFDKFSRDELKSFSFLLPPFLLLIIPTLLIMKQPDLGTSIIVLGVGIAMFFVAGAPKWLFAAGAGLVAVSAPVLWHFLHDYQKQRILTFLDPSKDPQSSGYHIIQSKIALGSGGLWGKGFLEGTQGALNFVPEKQTDFIFTIIAEEFGFVGSLVVLALFLTLTIYGYIFAARCKHQFGKLLAFGLTSSLFLYMFVNVAMVMGLLPVVGEPLPLMSYGGSSLITTVMALGFVMNTFVYSESDD